jgi:hypothetical protein
MPVYPNYLGDIFALLLPVLAYFWFFRSIAVMRGRQESEESIKHRWMAIKSVNERLSKRGAASNDSNCASVALLAGLEVFAPQIVLYMGLIFTQLMFGCPRNFNIHM